LTLYAVTELAGRPQVSLPEITLPVKVHLVNPVLGNNCLGRPETTKTVQIIDTDVVNRSLVYP